MTGIDRNRVKKSFSSQADKYDSLAIVQRRVAERFLELFIREENPPASILDVGSGTGRLVESLHNLAPSAFAVGIDLAHGMTRSAAGRFGAGVNVAFVCGDGEYLPFMDGSFDMIVSTSTYQWLKPADRAFTEARRVLKPGGKFCFALFGEETLAELRGAYRSALLRQSAAAADRSHNFATRDETLAALAAAGFNDCSVTREFEVEMHANVPALLRSLKAIGAGNASSMPSRGLAGRSVTAAMIDIYERNYGGAAGIPATYEVLYGSGIRP